MKNYFLIFICICISCSSNKEGFAYIDLSQTVTLSPAETIFDFDDKYPTSIKVLDSLLYIIQIKSEKCMMILNLNTKTISHSLGQVGHGPDDLISPNFIQSINSSDIIIEDGNLRKILKIDPSIDNATFIEYMEYPEALFISSELNFSKNFIAGRKVDAFGGKMFYIYNKNSGLMVETDYSPKLKNKVNDLNYTFAPAIALNERKNRVIAGMYFFDMFHLYNLKGERIKTFCFSEKCIPNVDKKIIY